MRVYEFMDKLAVLPAGAEITIMCSHEVGLFDPGFSIEKVEDSPADPMVCVLTLGNKK